MREETRKSLEVLANSEINVVHISGSVRVCIDRYPALDKTKVTEYMFIPQNRIIYSWSRNQKAANQTKIIRPVCDMIYFYFEIINNEQKVITIYPGEKFLGKIWHHQPETLSVKPYSPEEYPDSELITPENFMEIYQSLKNK